MRIYTRGGDDGSTGLLGGTRVRKDDLRVDSCGALDETNAAIGLACVVAGPAMQAMLRRAQNDLFLLGSHLAAIPGAEILLPPLTEQLVASLEAQIDEADARLPALRQFILPGGGELAARLHLARTICRRAERTVVACAAQNAVPELAIRYLNRLGDWLFVMARLANHEAGIEDIPWTKP